MISLELTDRGDTLAVATGDGRALCSYVYLDRTDQHESPRPYLHPVRTLAGDIVTIYRPSDHLWHRGFSVALPNVGSHNFWGGVTYTRDQGYVQLPNNGATVHERFGQVRDRGDVVGWDEDLTWRTQDGASLISEARTITARVLDNASWTFRWQAGWTNVSGAPVVFGSPTTEGRPMAGYGGFFWRGPREFTYGHVVAPAQMSSPPELAQAAPTADIPEAMGHCGDWLGFTARHDGTSNDSSVLVVDSSANPAAPAPWFVRAKPYACINPAPFYFTEHTLEPGQRWDLRYDVVITAGALGVADAESLAGTVRL